MLKFQRSLILLILLQTMKYNLILMHSLPVKLKYGAECITPKNEEGICISINSCPQVYATYLNFKNSKNSSADLIQVQHLQRSQCNLKNNIPYVCCPKNEVSINQNILNYLGELYCGRNSNRKIAHGEQADILSYRWMALLIYEKRPIFRCGGSLITTRYVLTAAHCFGNNEKSPIAVRLGEYDINSYIDCTGEGKAEKCLPAYEDVGIQHVFIPDDYVMNGLNNDIALIRLDREINLSKGIGLLCLPITKDLQAEQPETYTVSGWGSTEYYSNSLVLLFANLPHQSLNYCQQTFPLRASYLNESHICAGGDQLGDSCKGDSGGPLFSTGLYSNGDIRLILYGIVSQGMESCGQKIGPGIYTNVSYHMQWITDHMEQITNE